MEIYFEDLNKETQHQLLLAGVNLQKIGNGDPIGEMFDDMIAPDQAVKEEDLDLTK